MARCLGARRLKIEDSAPDAFTHLADAMERLHAELSAAEARSHAARLVEAYNGEAVNMALQCQNLLMEAGKEIAALSVLQVIAAIWEIEDGVAA